MTSIVVTEQVRINITHEMKEAGHEKLVAYLTTPRMAQVQTTYDVCGEIFKAMLLVELSAEHKQMMQEAKTALIERFNMKVEMVDD